MVPCERTFVAVAHTHTPRRTARPPAAPPRRERDEGMGQQRRSSKHVWEGSVMRHAARRFSLSGTAPPFRGRKVTATPYALVLLPRRRPPIPPSSFPPRMLWTPTSRPTLGLCPARSRPSAPHTHPGPTCTYKTNPASCSQKKRKNGKEETSGGDSPPMQHPREGLPSPKLCLSITPKPAAARGALGAACRTAAARG